MEVNVLFGKAKQRQIDMIVFTITGNNVCKLELTGHLQVLLFCVNQGSCMK